MKTELTKRERHNIYKKALELKNAPYCGGVLISQGLCVLIRYAHTGEIEYNDNSYRYQNTAKIFKEFNLFFEYSNDYNNKEREIILEFCIEMTKPIKRKK